MAKRQREVEKRDKAARKREKKEKRQSLSAAGGQDTVQTDGTSRVLAIFRRYLMNTGQMLCLSGNELDSNKHVLDQLVSDGLLTAETFKGGYSLTATGFDAMQSLACSTAS